MVPALALVLAAYLVGSVSFAVVVSRVFGLPDPHDYGSGNPGATNVLRTGNRAAALITLVGLMTFLGVNGEATAKWHEIGISSGQAAAFGAVVLAISGVLFMMGRPKKA